MRLIIIVFFTDTRSVTLTMTQYYMGYTTNKTFFTSPRTAFCLYTLHRFDGPRVLQTLAQIF